MAYLPPVGWADVATKRDLDHLQGRLESKIDRLDVKINGVEERLDVKIDGVEERLSLRLESTEHRLSAAFRGELAAAITAQTRSLTFAMAGLLFTATSTAIAAARFS